jgi:glutaredoxin-related protein
MADQKCINDFSAPSSSNVRTGPETNIGDGSFEPKLALINMVQQSPFCGRASEDANAHLQHFLEIYSTFTIQGVTQDAVCLRLFPFSLLGKAKQWFYSNKEAVST